MRQTLAEIGDGIQLLDSVLRKAIADDSIVPVQIVGLTDDVTTADPISEMAETNKYKLEELLAEIGTGSSAM